MNLKRRGQLTAVLVVALVISLSCFQPQYAGYSAATVNQANTIKSGRCLTLSPLWVTGFESGVISSSGTATSSAALLDTVTTNTAIDVGTTRSGSFSLKVSGTAPAGGSRIEKKIVGAPATLVLRTSVRLASTSSSSLLGIYFTNAGPELVLTYDSTSAKLGLSFKGNTVVYSTMTVSTGLWYSIDIKLNLSSNTWTGDWRINGVSQTQATYASTPNTVEAISLGAQYVNEVLTAYYDDVIATATATDYPLFDSRIEGLSINSYIGKNDIGGKLLTDAGAAVSAGSQTRLDEVPLTSSADYIKQTGVDSVAYAEYGFSDITRTGCVDAVSAVVTGHASGTSANLASVVIREGGVDRTVYNDDLSSSSTMEYRAKAITPASGRWTPTKLNAATTRIGYAATAPVDGQPYWDAVQLQYAQQPNADSAYRAVVMADNPVAYWRLGETSGSTAAAETGPNGTYSAGTIGVAGAVGDSNGSYYNPASGKMSANGNYSFAGTAPFSVEAWVRTTAIVGGFNDVVARGTFGNSSWEGWSITLYTDAQSSILPECDRLPGNTGELYGTTKLSLHAWYHIACTYDGANIKIFVNGVEEGIQANPVSLTDQPAVPTEIGSPLDTFNGSVDEPAIYNYALTPAQILAHYNAGKP